MERNIQLFFGKFSQHFSQTTKYIRKEIVLHEKYFSGKCPQHFSRTLKNIRKEIVLHGKYASNVLH